MLLDLLRLERGMSSAKAHHSPHWAQEALMYEDDEDDLFDDDNGLFAEARRKFADLQRTFEEASSKRADRRQRLGDWLEGKIDSLDPALGLKIEALKREWNETRNQLPMLINGEVAHQVNHADRPSPQGAKTLLDLVARVEALEARGNLPSKPINVHVAPGDLTRPTYRG